MHWLYFAKHVLHFCVEQNKKLNEVTSSLQALEERLARAKEGMCIVLVCLH